MDPLPPSSAGHEPGLAFGDAGWNRSDPESMTPTGRGFEAQEDDPYDMTHTPPNGKRGIVEADYTKALLSGIVRYSAQSLDRFVQAYDATPLASTDMANRHNLGGKREVLDLFDKRLGKDIRRVGSYIPSIQFAYSNKSKKGRVLGNAYPESEEKSDQEHHESGAIQSFHPGTVDEIPVVSLATHLAIESVYDSFLGEDDLKDYVSRLKFLEHASSVGGTVIRDGSKSKPNTGLVRDSSRTTATAAGATEHPTLVLPNNVHPAQVSGMRSMMSAAPYFSGLSLALNQTANTISDTQQFTTFGAHHPDMKAKVSLLGDMVDLRYKALSDACSTGTATLTTENVAENSYLSDLQHIKSGLSDDKQEVARDFSDWDHRDESMRDVCWLDWAGDPRVLEAAKRVIKEAKGLQDKEEFEWSKLSRSLSAQD
ncbi:hypothetical protein I317_06040 [Kwoniella heveanensis CBS 569]|nr:hypothetical protein I317_06040 [Kwoniella heveanensis CBS 569]